MLYDHLPKLIREKIADTWLKEKLLKLYLKSPLKVQYLIAKYTVKKKINKSMRQ